MTVESVLDFWFGPVGSDGEPDQEHRERWWRKSDEFDREIRERFGDSIERGARGELDEWSATTRGRLALIILLDQFSRNVFRDTPRSFAQDERALALALTGIEEGVDRELPARFRAFFYMPLMHSEDRRVQRRSVEVFAALRDGGGPDHVGFAEAHRDIVERFGRFPHRNAILGRPSTPEEAEFLTQPGSSF